MAEVNPSEAAKSAVVDPCAKCKTDLKMWKGIGIGTGIAFLITLIWAITK